MIQNTVGCCVQEQVPFFDCCATFVEVSNQKAYFTISHIA